MAYYRKTDGGIIVNIKVIPRSSRNEVAGVLNDELRIKLTAAPVDGKANRELINFLHGFISKGKGGIKIKKSDITILKGEISRLKQVLIKGVQKI